MRTLPNPGDAADRILTTGSDADLKKLLRERFPDWNIIRSDRGRWWAFRIPPKGDLNRTSDVDDDTPAVAVPEAVRRRALLNSAAPGRWRAPGAAARGRRRRDKPPRTRRRRPSTTPLLEGTMLELLESTDLVTRVRVLTGSDADPDSPQSAILPARPRSREAQNVS